MKPIPDLPDLQIVAVGSLQPHEHMDERRARPLVKALRREGVLKNPPVALPIGDRTERFIVLDGANRTTAFKLMDVPDILVQVVHAGGSVVRVETWNHVISCISPTDLVGGIERYPDLALIPSDFERASFSLSAGSSLAYLALRDGRVLEVVGETQPLAWRVRNMNCLVEAYKDVCQLERTSAARPAGLERSFPDLSGVMVFPRFGVEEVVAIAAAGQLLPAGLTRFIISPRALRVNYPLERLAADKPLEVKRQELADWLRCALGERRIRYYAEATFLFDE